MQFNTDFSEPRVIEVMYLNAVLGCFSTEDFIYHPKGNGFQNLHNPFAEYLSRGHEGLLDLLEYRRRPKWAFQSDGRRYPSDLLKEVAITRSRATGDLLWLRDRGEDVSYSDTIHGGDLY